MELRTEGLVVRTLPSCMKIFTPPVCADPRGGASGSGHAMHGRPRNRPLRRVHRAAYEVTTMSRILLSGIAVVALIVADSSPAHHELLDQHLSTKNMNVETPYLGSGTGAL